MAIINGEAVNAAGKSISEYLSEAGYPLAHVAVERNLEIVPKSKYDRTIICDEDSIEIVRFVGGG